MYFICRGCETEILESNTRSIIMIIILLGSFPSQQPAPVPQYRLTPPRLVLPEPEVDEPSPVEMTGAVMAPTRLEMAYHQMDRWFGLVCVLFWILIVVCILVSDWSEITDPKPVKYSLNFEHTDPKTYGVATRRLLGLPNDPPPSIGLSLYKQLSPTNVYAVNILALRLAFQSTVISNWTLLVPDIAAPIPSME